MESLSYTIQKRKTRQLQSHVNYGYRLGYKELGKKHKEIFTT